MSALLEASGVSKHFGGDLLLREATLALDNFSLRIDHDPAQIVAIVGESGSGKSTMARILLGLMEPTSGTIQYRGKELRKLSASENREYRREVQAIFQDPYESYNPFYTVDHVLTVPINRFRLAGSRHERAEMIRKAICAVGLRPEDTLGRFPHQLSGGQRQRIMVARALLLRPRLIIADEPVSMIDASLRAMVLAMLDDLKKNQNISFIYITHDLATAYQISDQAMVLYRGQTVESGPIEQIIKYPRHSYTKLLISSIPRADPKVKWGGALIS